MIIKIQVFFFDNYFLFFLKRFFKKIFFFLSLSIGFRVSDNPFSEPPHKIIRSSSPIEYSHFDPDGFLQDFDLEKNGKEEVEEEGEDDKELDSSSLSDWSGDGEGEDEEDFIISF